MKELPYDILVAGHVCLDIIPAFPPAAASLSDILVPGKLVDVGDAVTSTGGAVSNTGIALQRLGLRVSVMGKVGKDLFGGAVVDLFRRRAEGMADAMIEAPDVATSYSIVISPPGTDRIFLHSPGANHTFTAADVDDDVLNKTRILHFGYPPLMRSMYENDGRQAAVLFHRAKQLDLTTSLDMAKPDPASAAGRIDWKAWLKNVLPHVDLFLPSFEELLFMLEPVTYEDLCADVGADRILERATPELLKRLSDESIRIGAALVVIKLGEHGLYLQTSDSMERLATLGRGGPARLEAWCQRQLLSPCRQADVQGTTGAGDCTIAGFLAGFLSLDSPEDVVAAAVGTGACSTEAPDATSGIPAWDALQRRIQHGWPPLASSLKLDAWTWIPHCTLWQGPDDSYDHQL